MSKKLGLLTAAVVFAAFSSTAMAAQPDYNAWQSTAPGYYSNSSWPSLPIAAQAQTAGREWMAQAPNFATFHYGPDELNNRFSG